MNTTRRKFIAGLAALASAPLVALGVKRKAGLNVNKRPEGRNHVSDYEEWCDSSMPQMNVVVDVRRECLPAGTCISRMYMVRVDNLTDLEEFMNGDKMSTITWEDSKMLFRYREILKAL